MKACLYIILLFFSYFSLFSNKIENKIHKSFISDTLYRSKANENFYEVNKIEFKGNNFFSNNYLLDIISSKRSSRSVHHDIYQYFYDNLSKIPSTPKLLDTSFYIAIKDLSHEVKFFNQVLAETDLKIIQEGLNANGFHQAEVFFTFTADTVNKQNILTYHINENNQYMLDTIVYYGLEFIDGETQNKINQITYIDSKVPYSEEIILKEINSIYSILQNNGYYYSRYEIQPINVDTIKKLDSVTINFFVGKRQRITDIHYVDSLRGQNLIITELKEKLVDIKVGDWFNYNSLQTSLNNLNSLGTFEFVNIDTSSQFVPITDTTLSFVVTTKYRKQKEWSLGVFLNNTQIDNYLNFGVEGSLIHRNWGGAGQFGNLYTNLKLKDLSRVFAGLNGEWEGQIGFKMSQPLIWSLENMLISGSAGFYYSYSTINQLFNISAWYLPLRLPIKLTNGTYLNQIILDFNFEFQNPVNFLDVVNQIQNNNIDSSFSSENSVRVLQSYALYRTLFYYLNDPGIAFTTANLFGITLIGDSRNHPFSPTSGDFFYGSVDGWNFFLAHPWISGIAKYIRIQTAYSYFDKLADNLVSAFKFKIGAIKVFDTEKAYVPFERQFYAGGANSVRGWSSRELHYSVIEASADTNNKNGYFILPEDYSQLSNILGNAGVLEGSFELRYTLPRPRGVDDLISEQISRIGFVAFVDFGNAFDWFAENKVKSNMKWYEYFTKLAYAAGVGIRYDTPIGPIRADIGFPIYRPNYHLPDYKIWTAKNIFNDVRIHFGIGHAF
ncbi:MAG TPA: BamA/TamA family outer membrane protein [Candidatus Kapabacteria bacterium]|nr:BamA/TamA family outer membrane protein [Candidatus Kapabacteria bacterium]